MIERCFIQIMFLTTKDSIFFLISNIIPVYFNRISSKIDEHFKIDFGLKIIGLS